MICAGVRSDGSACQCERAPGCLYCYHHEAKARELAAHVAALPRHRLVELVDETPDEPDWTDRGMGYRDRVRAYNTHRARFAAIRETR